MIELPYCELRTLLSDGRIHCRHDMIQGFPQDCVTQNVCLGCIFRETPCDNPRPQLYSEEIVNQTNETVKVQESIAQESIAQKQPKRKDCGCGGKLSAADAAKREEDNKNIMQQIKDRMEKIKGNKSLIQQIKERIESRG